MHPTQTLTPPGEADAEPRLSRRALLRGLGAAAALWGAARPPEPARADPPRATADVDPGALIPKLLRRTTYGITEADLALATSLGYEGWLEHQLNHTAIPENPDLLARIASLSTLTMIPQQLYPESPGRVINELTEATILRAAYSKRQLFERMVEFWTDHFNIDILNGNDSWLKTVDDRDVIRAHALGAFPALLDASAHSPAMLYYLDNDTSTAGNPNENYARELMELHTMGSTGGYTQQDVVEVARCFTGWTLWQRSSQPTTGTFRFRANFHDTGQKIVLGNIIPAGGGIEDGLRVLEILVNHPSTARFIAGKLCRWLLGETPPHGAVDAVASAYTSTGGDIKAMIRAALRPEFLFEAPPRYKRPFHLFISIVRATGARLNTTTAMRQRLEGAGHRPFYWATPDGYPDTLEYWSGYLLPRWNFGASLMANEFSGASVNAGEFFDGVPSNADALARHIDHRFCAGEMTPLERGIIRDHIAPNPNSETRRREAMSLAAACPTFQWY